MPARSGLPHADLALALALGTVGGALFTLAQMPLAWMIGAMAATSAAAMAGLPVAVPGRLRSAMVVILGIMLGSAFHPGILDHAGSWLLSLAGVAVYIVLAAVAGTLFLRRFARFDPITAYFTAVPGGLNEMTLVGAAMGGDDRTISLSHSVRIMIVVMTVPVWFRFVGDYDAGARSLGPALGSIGARDAAVLAACALGAPLAKLLRLPASQLVGPMLLSVAVHQLGWTTGRPPGILVAAAQLVVGAAVGARFADTALSRIVHTMGIATALTVVMLALDVAMALLVNLLTGLPLPALVLAYAPGGLAEMSLVALALGIDPAFVSLHHLLRIILILLVAPMALRLWWRLTRRPP